MDFQLLFLVRSKCFDFNCIFFQNVNNLAFYSAYLPVTVESNLRPLTQGSPLIFQNCISFISSSTVGKFDEIYEKCLAEVGEGATTTVTEETTDIWTDATTDAATDTTTIFEMPTEETSGTTTEEALTTEDTTTADPETSTDWDCGLDCDGLFMA